MHANLTAHTIMCSSSMPAARSTTCARGELAGASMSWWYGPDPASSHTDAHRQTSQVERQTQRHVSTVLACWPPPSSPHQTPGPEGPRAPPQQAASAQPRARPAAGPPPGSLRAAHGRRAAVHQADTHRFCCIQGRTIQRHQHGLAHRAQPAHPGASQGQGTGQTPPGGQHKGGKRAGLMSRIPGDT